MREIKFRAWDKKNNKMLNNVSTGTKRVWDNNVEAEAKDCDFMQYIGASDKNNNDIYEGDFIIFSGRKGIFEVVYLDYDNSTDYPFYFLMCAFVLINKVTEDYMDFQWDDTDYMEVIGNIYERENK